MDVFVEQIVKKPADGKSTAFKALIGIGVGIVVLGSLFLTLIGLPIALLLAFGAIYAGYYFITAFDVEYEYILTNGEMDIDKIIAKRKRKRILTIKASSFEHFGKLSDAGNAASGVTVIKAGGVGEESGDEYYADFTHGNFGEVRLIFSPAEKVIEGIKPYLPRMTRIEFDKNNH